MQELQNVKQRDDESFDSFYDQSERLAERFLELKPSAAEIHKQLLMRGSRDTSFLEKVAMEPEMSRKKMKEIGGKLEDAMKLKEEQIHTIDAEKPKTKEEETNLQSEINVLKKTFAEAMKNTRRVPFKSNYPARRNDRPNNRSEYKKDRRNIECWGCGKSGHLKRECPEIECFECGKAGHLARFCQENPRRRQRQNCDECGNAGHATYKCALLRKRNTGR